MYEGQDFIPYLKENSCKITIENPNESKMIVKKQLEIFGTDEINKSTALYKAFAVCLSFLHSSLIERSKLGEEGFMSKNVTMTSTELLLSNYLLKEIMPNKPFELFVEAMRSICCDNIYGSKFQTF